MELYQLRTFVTVADEGNLSRAALRLNASQPAVSGHIKALEEELGVALFARTAKGMDLTPHGRRLTETAREALSRTQALLDQAKGLRGAVLGEVHLGRNTGPAYLRLPELLAAFTAANPQAVLHVDCCDSYNVAEALKAAQLDAAFAYGDCFDDRFTMLPLAIAPLRVIGPAAWRERLATATVRDLGAMPWVWFNENCPFVTVAERLLAEEGLTPQTSAVINDEETIKALVAAGQGLSLLRDDMVGTDASDTLAVWPHGVLALPLNLVVLARRREEPAVKALLDAACQAWDLAPA